MTGSERIVEVRAVHKVYRSTGGRDVAAVKGVSFDVIRGETFGLAGESGGGKSTLGRLVLGLARPSAGDILIDGRRVTELAPREWLPLRREMQMVFQNPLGALNPRRTVGSNVELPLINFGMGSKRARRARVRQVLDLVGLDVNAAERYPHELSGGQAQRVGIARALAPEPGFIFLDEPVSALDVSIQAQILNLLKDLQDRLGLTYLFVAHNLNVVRFMCDRFAVVQAGEIVEMGATQAVFGAPREPYTRRLIDAALWTGG